MNILSFLVNQQKSGGTVIILRIWKSQPGDYFFLATKSAEGKWREHPFSRKELNKVRDFIEEHQDRDIYWCPHGFSKPKRLKQYAVPPSLLWADLDEVDPREIKLKPTIAIESSPGRFVGLWMVEGKWEEEVNQRLTYYLGADKGGWDLTQVLRVPGTTNYKYESTPRVRLLWSDGAHYRIKDIEKQLPDKEEVEEEEVGNAEEVYKRYENKLPHWCRRELLNGRPTQGKRSEMIWKLQNTLIEVGLSTDECFVLIKACPWNKFAGRRNEDDQLRRELNKITRKHIGKNRSTKNEEINKRKFKFLAIPMDEVEEEQIDWIWYPYLARGELTILEGDPGLGKSYLAQMASSAIVDGKKLPSVKRLKPVQGKVAYFDYENTPGTVTKKRLEANGCENQADYFQEAEPFTIDNEDAVGQVLEAIERLKPTLVVFDTINGYIGKADSHKAAETQQAFSWFRHIARRFNCSVLVLRHLTKSSKEQALYRGQGSIAFAGLARVVITCGRMPDDRETIAMAVSKINVAKAPRALTFRIVGLPDTLKEQDRSKFEFGEFVDVTADQILSMPATGDASKERDDAKEFLLDVLDEGPLPLDKIERMAEARGVSVRTLRRAADELEVNMSTEGFGKKRHAVWGLKAA